MATYTYDPTKIRAGGKDQMRFELGDTSVDGASETCVLMDEEYAAIIAQFPDSWKRAKFELVQSILQRYSHEVNTTIGPLSHQYKGRYENWRETYEELKKELAGSHPPSLSSSITDTPPYFYKGMHDNPGGR